MFNLGFSEILIIGVLALLLIGPRQLPEVAKVLGRMIGEFKKATADLSGGLLEIKQDLKKPMTDGLDALAKMEQQVRQPNPFEDEDKTQKIEQQPLTKTDTDDKKT